MSDLIDKFLAQMTPAQEAVVLLRDIKSVLTEVRALLEKHFDGDDQRPSAGEPSDMITNVTPTKTPFLEKVSKGRK